MPSQPPRPRLADQVDQVVICSPDKDLAQCVRGNKVICLDRLRRRRYDEAGVVEKFGVSPRSIPDYLALVGDNADGIPGLPRWGAKSTGTVLARYRAIEEIPDRIADWDIKVRGGAGLAQILSDNREDAMLYKRLATLRTDVPDLGVETPDDMVWRGADRPALEQLCAELGDNRIVARIGRWRA